jgi:hypothetical protein
MLANLCQVDCSGRSQKMAAHGASLQGTKQPTEGELIAFRNNLTRNITHYSKFHG